MELLLKFWKLVEDNLYLFLIFAFGQAVFAIGLRAALKERRVGRAQKLLETPEQSPLHGDGDIPEVTDDAELPEDPVQRHLRRIK